jgi:hypothetical protein
MKNEFKMTLVVSRGVMFDVDYYTLGSNKTPHFVTSANEFNRPRTDWNRAGQAQEELLRDRALSFYHKWDKLHLKDLTQAEYDEIIHDIEYLKEKYRYYIKTNGEDIHFSEQVELEREYRTR